MSLAIQFASPNLTRATEQLNAARSSQRDQLYIELLAPIDELSATNSICCALSLRAYHQAMKAAGVWPFDRTWGQRTLLETLNALARFAYTMPSKPSAVIMGDHLNSGECMCTKAELQSKMPSIIIRIRNDFGGLCLDCMHNSNQTYGSATKKYWCLRNRSLSQGCRFKHGHSSWTFSYMGRKEDWDRLRGHLPIADRERV